MFSVQKDVIKVIETLKKSVVNTILRLKRLTILKRSSFLQETNKKVFVATSLQKVYIFSQRQRILTRPGKPEKDIVTQTNCPFVSYAHRLPIGCPSAAHRLPIGQW